MSELPKGWAEAELKELIGLAHTGLVRSAKEQSDDFEYPYLKMNNLSISGSFLLDNMTKVNATSQEVDKYTLEYGDFLFNTRNSVELVGKCGVYKGNGIERILFNNNLLKIKFLIILPDIIAYWFNSVLGKKQLSEITSATTSVAAIYQKVLMTRRVPIPPLAEQKRIVKKLDEVLAQVDTIKARLDGIPDLLKRFRQSVLASAVSGKLTEEWRGGQLFSSASKELKEITSIDIGHAFKSKEFTECGIPLLRGQNIEPGSLRWSETKHFPVEKLDKFQHLFIDAGDIILAMDRPIVSAGLKLARAVSSDLPCVLVQRVARLKGKAEELTDDYLYLLLKESSFANYLVPNQTGSDIPHISGKQIQAYRVSVPSLEEQKEIVRLVDQYFAFADTIEAQVKKAQTRVDKLTQSILAKAFRGELVDQDPNDEPADKLLERIAEARKEAEALAKAAKKARSTKSPAKKRAAKSA
ncbi:hypothetical protein NM09_06880 [Vibrio caribbeanicus]|uniref:Uncharacterized protein n=1 Tax=Vibrio caribbeanicus TaxID=701175 RepID=A0ACC4NYW7_9VIBR|nr:restriction endonuclease subunit S [Vibrio caribbeanicus]KHD25444.1 hypothetical protein NM09_06880 [Vibrio caribbeanicus]